MAGSAQQKLSHINGNMSVCFSSIQMFQLQYAHIPLPLLSFFGCNLFHWLCGCLGPEKFSSLAIYDSESGAEAKEFQPSHLAFTLGEKWILSLREGLLGRDPLRRLSAIISFKYKSHLAAAHDDVTQLKSLTLRQQKALQWLTFWFRGPKWKAENSFQSARLFVFFLFFFFVPNSAESVGGKNS